MDEPVEVRDDGVAIEFHGQEFLFSKSELRCQSCRSGQVELTFAEEHEEGDVQALALGTECKDCGEPALHLAY